MAEDLVASFRQRQRKRLAEGIAPVTGPSPFKRAKSSHHPEPIQVTSAASSHGGADNPAPEGMTVQKSASIPPPQNQMLTQAADIPAAPSAPIPSKEELDELIRKFPDFTSPEPKIENLGVLFPVLQRIPVEVDEGSPQDFSARLPLGTPHEVIHAIHAFGDFPTADYSAEMIVAGARDLMRRHRILRDRLEAAEKIKNYAIAAAEQAAKLEVEISAALESAASARKTAEVGAGLLQKSENERERLRAEVEALKADKVVLSEDVTKKGEEISRLRREIDEQSSAFANEKEQLKNAYMKQVDDMYFIGYGRCLAKHKIANDFPSDDEAVEEEPNHADGPAKIGDNEEDVPTQEVSAQGENTPARDVGAPVVIDD